IELGRVGRKVQEAHVFGMGDLLRKVAGGVVYDEHEMMIMVSLAEMLELRKVSKQRPSTPGRYEQKLSPLVGSTAA
ncbi:MAG: hypothetical protein LC781_19160, partial [Actinobacteria bacterium]|nr:hypothetical protein [Actinomycetota bacterium]